MVAARRPQLAQWCHSTGRPDHAGNLLRMWRGRRQQRTHNEVNIPRVGYPPMCYGTDSARTAVARRMSASCRGPHQMALGFCMPGVQRAGAAHCQPSTAAEGSEVHAKNLLLLQPQHTRLTCRSACMTRRSRKTSLNSRSVSVLYSASSSFHTRGPALQAFRPRLAKGRCAIAAPFHRAGSGKPSVAAACIASDHRNNNAAAQFGVSRGLPLPAHWVLQRPRAPVRMLHFASRSGRRAPRR